MMRDAQRWGALAVGQRTRARRGERIIEGLIALVSRSAIVFVFLVFLFVLREAWPILTGQANSALLQKTLPLEEMDRMTPEQLRAYLGLSRNEFAAMERETIRELMKVKLEAAAEAPPDKDEKVNTASWRFLLRPYQWTGYDRPVYIWQPISQIQKYNLVPLFIGTLKTTAVALLFAVPLALAAAVYVSQLAPRRWKEFLKPGIELLAGVPSVVLGFFALLVMASLFQGIFGYRSRLNSFVAGIALGLAVIPVIFSIAEDALSSVPRSYTQAALALGANPWQAAWNIVVPAAAQGIFAAIILGFGRAIGETMIVLMASGNASIMSADIFDSTRTMTATIAAELAEAVQGGAHYQILFLIGTLLFIVTFASNLAGDIVVQRLKRRLAGS